MGARQALVQAGQTQGSQGCSSIRVPTTAPPGHAVTSGAAFLVPTRLSDNNSCLPHRSKCSPVWNRKTTRLRQGAEGSNALLPNPAHRHRHAGTPPPAQESPNHLARSWRQVNGVFSVQRGGKLSRRSLGSHSTAISQLQPTAPGRMAEANIHFQGPAKTSQVTLSPSAQGESASSRCSFTKSQHRAFLSSLERIQALAATPYQR